MLLLFRNRASGGGGDSPPGFNPLTDYWWDGSDPTTMWQDATKTTPVIAASPVRVWTSKGVALDAVAPSDPARATWDGGSNLTFSGAQEYFAAIGTGTYASPVTIVVVAQRAVTNVRHTLVTPNNNISGRLFMFNNALESSAPNITLITPDGLARGVAIGSFGAAESALRWNGLDAVGGAAAFARDDLRIGNKGTYSSSVTYMDGDIATVYFKFGIAANAVERAALEAWFAAKYGVVLP